VRGWLARFRTQVALLVQAERARQRQARPRQVGRPKEPLVTGSLIGDGSSTAGARVRGLSWLPSPSAPPRCALAMSSMRRERVTRRDAAAY